MLLQLFTWARTRFHQDEGATMVEYGIMVALIAAIAIATIAVLGNQVHAAFCTIVAGLGGTGVGCPA